MIKVCIPFNMIIDTDFGMIRAIEKTQNLSEYSVNKIKSILVSREEENPLISYAKARDIQIPESAYELLFEKFYDTILKLSQITDILSFIINTYKIGLNGEVKIVIGCDQHSEIDYIKSILKSSDYSVDTSLKSDMNLNDFDCIFTKYFDEYYVDYLVNQVNLTGKRIYIANYPFNLIYDKESNKQAINPILHMNLENKGNVLSTVSLYNKK